MRTVKINWVKRNSPDMVTLYFEDEACSKAIPGQYAMIWIPGGEEIPMSLSTISSAGNSSLTVREIGDTTKTLCNMKKGEKIGVRGPFGRGFTLIGKQPLIVSGGSGIASLIPLAEAFTESGIKPDFILGARTEADLGFRGRLEKLLGDSIFLATDDGSFGFHGFSSQYAARLMDRGSYDIVYTCGPELMMVSIFDEAESQGIPVQACLERYIKCSHGLCGSCGIGPYRVCMDGPVFDSEKLREIREDFGIRKMDPTGKIVRVNH
ncbi:MAG: dihydroorotate dehydrogenase electron transfer subunit [Candidatus Bathyarchaeota archaeon]|jgi:dihydroorotate dehydrogenase electron transfer subunit|nr:dihydroorotate dehydrogenase electron transfer subunit [Candidatus Bathyarchaeota archaeon]